MKLLHSSLALLATSALSVAYKQSDNQVVFSNDHNEPNDLQFKGLTDYTFGNFSLLSLHRQLVQAESLSNHEVNASRFLKHYLESFGLTVELQEIQDGGDSRQNVYAYLGKTRDTKVVLTSHIDTVPPYLQYRVEGSRIYGRGSSDAKASVATQIGAFLSLVESGDIQEGEVSLLYVVGEEVSGVGMRIVDQLGVQWESAIFGEPTELKLGVGHKGGYVFELTAEGKAAHSGYPYLGVSATEILIPVLNDLLNVKWPESELLGPSTLNIGKFEGGLALNVIPAHAQASLFIRVAADLDRIDQLVREVVEGVDNLKFELVHKIGPVHLDYEVPGFESIILAYATDVPNLKVELKKRYLYGPGTILVAHSDHEYVENADLLESIDGYKRLVKHALSE